MLNTIDNSMNGDLMKNSKVGQLVVDEFLNNLRKVELDGTSGLYFRFADLTEVVYLKNELTQSLLSAGLMATA